MGTIVLAENGRKGLKNITKVQNFSKVKAKYTYNNRVGVKIQVGIIVISNPNLHISDKFLRIFHKCLDISDKFLSSFHKFLDISEKFHRISGKFLRISEKFLRISGKFLRISEKFLRIYQKNHVSKKYCIKYGL